MFCLIIFVYDQICIWRNWLVCNILQMMASSYFGFLEEIQKWRLSHLRNDGSIQLCWHNVNPMINCPTWKAASHHLHLKKKNICIVMTSMSIKTWSWRWYNLTMDWSEWKSWIENFFSNLNFLLFSLCPKIRFPLQEKQTNLLRHLLWVYLAEQIPPHISSLPSD